MFQFFENNVILIVNAVLLVGLGIGVSDLRQSPALAQPDNTQNQITDTSTQVSPEINQAPIEVINNPNSPTEMKTKIPRRLYEDYDDEEEDDD